MIRPLATFELCLQSATPSRLPSERHLCTGVEWVHFLSRSIIILKVGKPKKFRESDNMGKPGESDGVRKPREFLDTTKNYQIVVLIFLFQARSGSWTGEGLFEHVWMRFRIQVFCSRRVWSNAVGIIMPRKRIWLWISRFCSSLRLLSSPRRRVS